MSEEKTQHQNPAEKEKARELSLEPSKPPAQIEGYRVTRFLGSGAYGEVWAGIDQNTGRRVAIKFYTRRSRADVALLAQEVEKLVVLSADRYVVQLYDVGWEATPPYYVMDFIEHGSLEDRLKAERTIPVADAIDMFQEISTGLMHLHGKGVLHCDIKPGNILLDQDNKPRLADFGQSRLSTDATAALGTLYFMAPEQADLNAQPDSRWDVYALGALLYSMLTGEPPYRNNELSAQMEGTGDIRKRLRTYRDAINKAPKPKGHRKVPGVDRTLADIIDRCIHADPNKRFSSIQSVVLAMRQRQENIAFRPLLLLGLLGPFLLMGLMGLFGWYAYQRAVGDTDAAVTKKAIESNGFAARLAARSASEQIDKYLRGVRSLSGNISLSTNVALAMEDASWLDLRCQLTDPNQNRNPSFDATRDRFLGHPQRNKLQNLLESLVKQDGMPSAASWWIYDSFGIQCAAYFETNPSNATIGKNYSYRSYFTGKANDLIQKKEDGSVFFNVQDDFDNRPHLERPYISAVFFSDATSTWKIAFSAPIFDKSEFIGVIGLTVEMGSFIEFESGQMQYAMMVDGRKSEHQGIVLEHPLFDALLADENNSALHESLTHCQVDMKAVLKPSPRFNDPIGDQELGADYRSDRIAACVPIEFTDLEAFEKGKIEKISSGLYVIAVEDYAKIIGPSQKLGRQLAWLGSIASLILLLVALGLWFLVLKTTRGSRQRFVSAFLPIADSTRGSIHSSETVGQLEPNSTRTK